MNNKGEKTIWLAIAIMILSFLFLIYVSVDREKSESNKQNIDTLKVELKQIQETQINLQKIIESFNQPQDGVDGSDGVDGTNGRNGTDGRSGSSGKDGANGKSVIGLSAYELWLAEGNTGSPKDFLDSLKGEAGPAPQIRYNPSTGNLETKLPTDFFWDILVPKCVLETNCP